MSTIKRPEQSSRRLTSPVHNREARLIQVPTLSAVPCAPAAVRRSRPDRAPERILFCAYIDVSFATGPRRAKPFSTARARRHVASRAQRSER